MPGYIEKEKALLVFGEVHPLDYNTAGYASKIRSIPVVDVVEVVRCGECQHYNDKLEMYSDYVCTIRHYCDGSPIIVGKDDFCSSGRRKDGGQDGTA